MSDERIRAACPECGAHLAAPPGAVGRRVRCPKCQHAFRIEAPAETPHESAPPALDDDLLSGLASGAAVDAPEVRQARATAAAVAPPPPVFTTPAIPQAAASASGGFAWSAFIVNFGRFFLRRGLAGWLCVFFVMSGISLAAYGIHEFWLRSESSDVAQTMTCHEFESAASIGNRHIVLTDFAVLPDYMYQRGLAGMKGAWVPIIPVEIIPLRLADEFRTTVDGLDEIPEADRLAALNRFRSRDFNWRTMIYFEHAFSEEYLALALDVETIEGMYMREGKSGFKRAQQDLLEDAYPNVDLSKCRIIAVGHERASVAGAGGMILGGIALIVGALGYAARAAMYETIA